MAFRPDIQLLRAVAVLLVLGYHLGFAGFGNGLLGVDAFFVISGYLMEKLYRPGDGAITFWRRRAARLLPAYFTILVVTLVTAFLVVLPDAFAQVAAQAVSAALFVPNIQFWSADNYFNPISFVPLLHLWSLGVEFQYYLLVPAIVLLVRRWPWLMGLMILGSLLACLAMVTISPKTSFFMVPLRLWEFGLGMLVASRRGDAPILPRWVFPVALAGLAALMALPIDGTATSIVRGHPALGAMLACALTGLALASGLRDTVLDNRLGRGAVRLGDISYSLYLVHFPLIALVGYVPFGGTRLGNGDGTAVLLFAIALGLAILLHRLVERPGGSIVTWPRALMAAAVMAAIALVAPRVQQHRFDPYEQKVFAGFEDRAPYRCGKMFRITNFGEGACILAPASGERTVLLVGDSHADAIKRSFAAAATANGTRVAFPVSNEPLLIPALGPDWLLGEAKRVGATHIYLHYHSAHLTPALVEATVVAARAKGIGVTVILPVPEDQASIPALLYAAHRRGVSAPMLDRAAYDRSIEPLLSAFAKMEGVDVLPVARALCGAGPCPLAAADGTTYYFDANHLTLTGARRLQPIFAAHIAGLAPGRKSDSEAL
nr:acyltransferase family protein [Sphingomonas kaistensis]